MKLILVILSILIISTEVNADFMFQQGQSVRALGMGNAYTAVVADDDAIYYNPAALSKMNGFNWTILDPAIGLNGLNAYSEYSQMLSNAGNDLASVLNELYGQNIWSHLGLKSLISIGGLSFGAYGNADVSLLLNNPALPTITADYLVDYAYYAGFGFEFVPKVFSLGGQIRRITRLGGEIPIGPSSIVLLDPDVIASALDGKQGTAYAADLGMLLTFPVRGSPTIGVSWKDMGNTAFIADVGKLAPDSIASDLTVGISMNIDMPGIDIKPALDVKYLNQGGQIGKKIHFGVEVDMPMIDVRAGFNQGYYTLGASFNLFLMRVDAATYGVELGEYPGQLEDRRYMLQISMGFGIDPSLGLSWGSDSSTESRSVRSRRKKRR